MNKPLLLICLAGLTQLAGPASAQPTVRHIVTSRLVADRALPAESYDPLFDTPPKNVPTPKTPDAPLAGNGDIGIVQGGAPDSLTFYLGKNDFWRAYPVYPGGGIALPGGLTLLIPRLSGASYHARESMNNAAIESRFDNDSLRVSLHSWVTATHHTVVIECASNLAVK